MGAPGKKRRSQPRTKASAQYLHAKKRALERYGIELTKDRYRALCQDIRLGAGTCLGRQSLRVSVWRITVFMQEKPSVICNVVYDTSRGTIVTFLPPGITDAKGVAL